MNFGRTFLEELAQVADNIIENFKLSVGRKIFDACPAGTGQSTVFARWVNKKGDTLDLIVSSPLFVSIPDEFHFHVTVVWGKESVSSARPLFFYYPANYIFAITLPFALDIASYIPFFRIELYIDENAVTSQIKARGRSVAIIEGGSVTLSPSQWQSLRDEILSAVLYEAL